jgi:hypothetical protein
MTHEAPTRVVLYSIAPGQRAAVAEFTRDEDGVSLRVLDPKWGGLAQDDYDDGISSDAQDRVVPSSEPEAFMRALVEPRQAGYWHYVDRSGDDPATDPDRPGDDRTGGS